MRALRQLHELMLCGDAAEHQLALISDAAEIADTYPTPPDEVPSANPHSAQKACICKFKNEGVNSTKTSVMSIANLK